MNQKQRGDGEDSTDAKRDCSLATDAKDDAGANRSLAGTRLRCELVSVDFDKHTMTVELPMALAFPRVHAGSVEVDISGITGEPEQPSDAGAGNTAVTLERD